MHQRALKLATLAIGLVGFATGCGDGPNPVGPDSVAPSQVATSSDTAVQASPLQLGPIVIGSPSTTTGTQVVVLQRTVALSNDVTASRTIGLLGGVIALPSAGLSFVVPPGAVLRNTKITVTAPAGKLVAYTFAPHGLKFLVPAIATVDLRNTTAYGNSTLLSILQAGYFTDDLSGAQQTGLETVQDLLAVQVRLGTTAVFTVPHFSGYLLASGHTAQ
ncbi:MAG TPA: hypothetical protein VFW89_06160 [Gemmatimonadaceae bacterium]|nr:hypothetical protein [Gemmatimonadaceae bacterium]